MPYQNMMAASLHVSTWKGEKVDAKASAEVLEAKHADSDAGTFSKVLVPKRLLAGVDSAHFAARRDFRRLTLPFDHGMGVVSGAMFDEFRTTMVQHRQRFEAEADKFVSDIYPSVLAEAQVRLAGLYEADDFPRPDALRAKFRMQVALMPVTAAAELKLDHLTETVQAELKAEYEAQLEERMRETRQEMWRRLIEPATLFAQAMQDPERVFKESTVENLRQIAEMAPRMCVAPDPELNAMCSHLKGLLANVDAKVLRRDDAARQEAAFGVKLATDTMERKLAWLTGGQR